MKKEEWKKITQFTGPEDSPGFLLWQVSTEWRRQVENALVPLNITHPQFVILASTGWLTREKYEVSQVELARHCKIDVTMTSQILRALEKKGLIERRQREANEKSKFPHLTKLGMALVKKAIPLVEKVDIQFFERLGRDVGSCVDLLKNLLK